MKINLIKGDITKLKVDAIVNAAKNSLMGGGGVDGAIHAAGGKAILDECKVYRSKNGDLATGEAVITTAGDLPAKYVIHTVGPVWQGGNKREAELLEKAYNNCLKLALENGLQTIAFPNISTGVYGYPKPQAAEVAINTVKNFLTQYPDLEVTFVCFDEDNLGLYKSLL